MQIFEDIIYKLLVNMNYEQSAYHIQVNKWIV